VVEVRNPAPVLLAGQDDGAATLYNVIRMPNSTTLAIGGGGSLNTGVNNVFIGTNTGNNNTTGVNNLFFGLEAGLNNTIGSRNNFSGNNAGANNTTGNDNNFFGLNAGQNNTTGSSNNFFGNQAGRFNRIGSNNNFFGTSAGLGNSIGNSNNFFGFRTGESNAGSNNNFFGSQSGFRNTTASGNNFFGNQAGFNNTTGSDNNFFGNQAGRDNIVGTGNNFFGSLAGVSSIGNRNNFFGQSAGQLNKGDNNNFFGLNTGSINTIGSGNNFFGNQAGRSNTRGSNNNFIGSNTGYNTTAADTLTGSNNNVIGSESARNIASAAAGNLVLGNSVNLPTGNGSNQVVIKNLIFGTGASGTGTTIQTTAKAGINVNNPQSTLDVEGNMAIGATYSGTTAAPTNGLIVEGNTGIGTSSPQRRLHVTGTVRVDTLTRDVPTRIVGADADGDLAAVTLGTGLSIASGTLNTSAILPADTSVFARDWQIAGTANYLSKFTGASSVGNSVLYNEFNSRVSHSYHGYSPFLSVKNAYHLFGSGTTSDDQPIHFIEGSLGTTSTLAPQLRLLRSRATTPYASGGRVQFGDYLGYLSFWPNENTLYNQPSAYIAAVMDSITGNADFPTSIRFAVAPNGSEGAVERVTINNAGRVGIGTTSPNAPLTVIGASSFGGLSAMSGRFSDNANSSLYISHSSISGPVYSANITSSDDLTFGQTITGGTTEYMRIKATTGRVGIGTSSPARTLHVEGEARISDLTTDTPTRIVGADADGDLGAITLGTGLSISSGTLNASGITSVYIPINLFSPGDTVTNTTNSKNFFLVHSGLNGYCIDSYTVKAIAGTGSADIQLDKNNTGGNLQAISGTTVYTKDTNIALVTGDYIRGQVFNLSGTLVGLGLTLEIKATCN
jgi:hypothetical protein